MPDRTVFKASWKFCEASKPQWNMINETTYHWSMYCYIRQLKSNINHSLLDCYHNYGCQKVLTLFSKLTKSFRFLTEAISFTTWYVFMYDNTVSFLFRLDKCCFSIHTCTDRQTKLALTKYNLTLKYWLG